MPPAVGRPQTVASGMVAPAVMKRWCRYGSMIFASGWPSIALGNQTPVVGQALPAWHHGLVASPGREIWRTRFSAAGEKGSLWGLGMPTPR